MTNEQIVTPDAVKPYCPSCASYHWVHVDSIPVEGWEEFSGMYCTECGFFILD